MFYLGPPSTKSQNHGCTTLFSKVLGESRFDFILCSTRICCSSDALYDDKERFWQTQSQTTHVTKVFEVYNERIYHLASGL